MSASIEVPEKMLLLSTVQREDGEYRFYVTKTPSQNWGFCLENPSSDCWYPDIPFTWTGAVVFAALGVVDKLIDEMNASDETG